MMQIVEGISLSEGKSASVESPYIMGSLSKKLRSLRRTEASRKPNQTDTAIPLAEPVPPTRAQSTAPLLNEMSQSALPAALVDDTPALGAVLDGSWVRHTDGRVWRRDWLFPKTYEHGKCRLQLQASRPAIARLGLADDLAHCPLSDIVFLDTETTGLGGSAYVFMVGFGRWNTEGFLLTQLMMDDPSQEKAMLEVLRECVQDCRAMVTFNGKSFDIPMLHGRYAMQQSAMPLQHQAHLDLLPMARRIWRNRLPSRRLAYLEEVILGAERTGEDIEGRLIPEVYFQFLRDHNAAPLKPIFYHNAMDIVAMATLFSEMAFLLEAPHDGRVQYPEDLLGIASMFDDMGDTAEAKRLYRMVLAQSDTKAIVLPTLLALSRLEKQQQNFEAALPLWEKAAALKDWGACVEIAKFYEHQIDDFTMAMQWTQKAIQIVRGRVFGRLERKQHLLALRHRMGRLRRKQRLQDREGTRSTKR